MNEETVFYDICIAGIGIAGLSAAISLIKESKQLNESNCMRIILCERDCSLHNRRQGYGLTLTNSLTGPLARLGVLDKCIERNCLSRSHFSFKPDGTILGYYGRIGKGASLSEDQKDHGGNRGNLRIPREELRNLLLAELISLSDKPNDAELLAVSNSSSNANISTCNSVLLSSLSNEDSLNTKAIQHISTNNIDMRWGYKFLYYREDDESVISYFEVNSEKENGSKASSKIVAIRSAIVIGADGIKSRVRQSRDAVLSTSSIPKELSISLNSLNYLGITVIIGISKMYHPLLYERGFYVLDGDHRLFIMPYYTPQTNESDISPSTKEEPLIMWQLSFRNLNESESTALRSYNFEQLLVYAKSHVSGWFEPVEELIARTLTNEIWVTPLYDRDRMQMQNKYDKSFDLHHRTKTRQFIYLPNSSYATDDSEQLLPAIEDVRVDNYSELSKITPAEKEGYFCLERRRNTRVTVIGDACHPMSMFKGQGANQSLEDGMTLAKWLVCGGDTKDSNKKDKGQSRTDQSSDRSVPRKRSHAEQEGRLIDENPGHFSFKSLPKDILYHRIKLFEQEMVSKTFQKVLMSRKAAKELHSDEIADHISRNTFLAVEGSFREVKPGIEEDTKMNVHDYIYSINGIKSQKAVSEILKRCFHQEVTAKLKEDLEPQFERILFEVSQD